MKGEKGGNYYQGKILLNHIKVWTPLSQIPRSATDYMLIEVKGKFVALALYKYISVYLTRMKPLLIGHSEVVQLLLYSGFDPKQKDRFGQVCCKTVLCNNFAL